jgi:hypothetical protein
MRAPWYDALAGSLWPARPRIGVRRRVEPSCDPCSTRHAGATLLSRSTSFATPIVHPISPSDDDLVDLTIAPLHTCSNAHPVARDSSGVARRDRDDLKVIAAAGARRLNAPSRKNAVHNRGLRAWTHCPLRSTRRPLRRPDEELCISLLYLEAAPIKKSCVAESAEAQDSFHVRQLNERFSIVRPAASRESCVGQSDCARQWWSRWPTARPHTLQSALSSLQSALRWSSESQLRQPLQLARTAAKNSYSDSYLDSTGYLRIALSSNSTQIARAI